MWLHLIGDFSKFDWSDILVGRGGNSQPLKRRVLANRLLIARFSLARLLDSHCVANFYQLDFI